MTNEQIEAAFDDLGYGITFDELTIIDAATRTDIRLARKDWNRPGLVEQDDEEAFIVLDAQPMAGQPRRTVVILPVGENRYAVMGSLK